MLMQPAVSSAAPQFQVEWVGVDTLIPSPDNPRVMPPAEMTALERSIAEFGLVDPLLVRKADRTLIGGHQRLAVAKKLGLATVPVIFLDVSEPQAVALRIALNKISGDWDREQLGSLLAELRAQQEIDVTLTGFDTEELEELFAELEAQQAGPAFSPEAERAQQTALAAGSAPARVRPGQLWQLDRHRLWCGDSLGPGALARVCEGRPVPLVVTDPPYGVDFRSASKQGKAPIANDEAAGFASFLERALPAIREVVAPGGTLYWFAAGGGAKPALAHVLLAVSRHFELRNCLVWDKESPGLGRHWRPSWEAIVEATAGARTRWYGGTHRRNVLRYGRLIPDADEHPTPKPTDLLAELIRVSSRPTEAVLDPFAGSGSTLLACELTGRRCSAAELEPGYCSLIVARWEAVTGQQARLAEDVDDGCVGTTGG
jgi:site-specific DNA-methyltransferase (adenine-specific)